MKEVGPQRIFAGVDKAGNILESDTSSAGGNMRQLDAGVWIQLPDDNGVGKRWWRLKAWVILIQVDMLGRWQLGPTVESSQATHPCDKCNFDTSKLACFAPCTFVDVGNMGIFKAKLQWTERSTDTLDAQVAQFKALTTAAARNKFTKETGIKKDVYPFHRDCTPSTFPARYCHLVTASLPPRYRLVCAAWSPQTSHLSGMLR